MIRTTFRFTLLSALAGVVLVGPSLAICSTPSPQGCCCSDSCPADALVRLEAVGCCAPAPPAPTPPTGSHERITATAASALPPVSAELPAIVRDRPAAACHPAPPLNAGGVPLFTLHASLLI